MGAPSSPPPPARAEATATVTIAPGTTATADKEGRGGDDGTATTTTSRPSTRLAPVPAPAPPAPPPSPPAKPPQDRDFSAFPHRPYEIQTRFMQALYSAIEEKRLALFESPTGTGKTLSLVVGALTWLEDKRRAAAEAAVERKGGKGGDDDDDPASSSLREADSLPPWLREAAEARDREAKGLKEEKRQRRLRKARERRDAALQGVSRAEWAARARRRAAKAKEEAASAASRRERARKANEGDPFDDGDDDEQFLLGSSGDEGGAKDADSLSRRRPRTGERAPSFSSSSSDDGGGDDSEGRDSGDDAPRARVVVASRTHSQLSQFVSELRRTRFGGSDESALAAVSLGSRAQLCINDAVLRGSGGGPAPASLVAERCRDLQRRTKTTSKKARAGEREGGDEPKRKKEGSSTCGCPFRNPPAPPPSDGNGSAAAAGGAPRRAMRDALLSRPTDVEEAASAGRALGACPYYASRAALPDADVVFVPYSGLLSADAREAVGLELKNAVVVVDEAHNLPSAVASAFGCRVSLPALRVSTAALRGYLERYGTRLSPSGRRDVQMLLGVGEALTKRLLAAGESSGSSAAPRRQKAFKIDAFASSAGLDNVNAFRLVRSLKEKHAVAKVAGAADAAAARERRARARAEAAEGSVVPAGRRRTEGDDDDERRQPTPTSALHALVSFASALTTADDDGRVIVEAPSPSSGSEGALRFVLLNAGARFGAVLSEARAVVLASGTLEPSASLAAQLFPPPTATATSTTTATSESPPSPSPLSTAARFSCGHVLPSSRLLALSLGAGPTGRTLDLRASARNAPESMDEVAALLTNVCSVVPGGVVAFFPSFAYLGAAVERWKSTGALGRMGAKKETFIEPRGASEVAATLAAFGRAARGRGDDGDDDGGGATAATTAAASSSFAPARSALPPVASDKKASPGGALLLSVIGAKLSEGINFGDGLGRAVVVLGIPYPSPEDAELVERMSYLEKSRGRGSGRALYEDTASVAVNQCVGRVVRHARDWAAVVLADARYTKRSTGDSTSSHASDASSSPSLLPPVERLPAWMKPSLRVATSYGDAHSSLARFCREMARRDEGEKKG